MSTLNERLRSAPTGCRAVLLVRHGERAPIIAIDDAARAGLTAQGYRDAVRCGVELGGSAHGSWRVWHSPLARCRQSAEGLQEGLVAAGRDVRLVGPLKVAGTPYFHDWDDAVRCLVERGSQRFWADWCAGALPARAVQAAAAAARVQLRALREALTDSDTDTVDVIVSHEWNLLLLEHHYLNIDTSAQPWPGYLDGIVVHREDDALVVTGRVPGQQACLTFRDK